MLTFHEVYHVIFYSIAAGAVYLIAERHFNLRNYFLGLFFTFFIDLDHLLDYFLHWGGGFNLKRFLLGSYFPLSGKVIVFMHGWEYIILLAFFYLVQKNKLKYSWLLFIILSLFVHLVYDSFYYGISVPNYFVIWRLLNGFSDTLF